MEQLPAHHLNKTNKTNCQKRGFGNTNGCASVQQGFDIMLEYTNVYQQQKNKLFCPW